MRRALIHWIASAVAIFIVSQIVPGFVVTSPSAALLAVLVIGLVNATLGLIIKIITFPLTIMTLGLFWLVINAAMIELASTLINGFYVANFASAFVGGIVLSIVNMVMKWLVKPLEE